MNKIISESIIDIRSLRDYVNIRIKFGRDSRQERIAFYLLRSLLGGLNE